MTALDESPESETPSESAVSAHQCSESRVVFVERDNSDGWIATDLTVALER